MKVLARRTADAIAGGFAHQVDIEGGHTLLVDEPQELGGTDTGPSPGRLLASSLAACTAITIEMYAKRKEWEIGAIEVEVDATYNGHMPTAFAVTVRLPAGLDEEQRDRLLTVGSKCPVHKLLSGEASVSIVDRVEAL